MMQEELKDLQSKIMDAASFIRPLKAEVGRILSGQES